MAFQLNLTDPKNYGWISGTSFESFSRHLVGRADGKYRIERYSFTVDNLITKLSLKFTDDPNGNIFTHYGGTDKRAEGFGFYVTDTNYSNWSGLYPGQSAERTGKLTFEDIENDKHEILKGELDLTSNPLKPGNYYLFIYGFQSTSAWGCMNWAYTSDDKIYYPNADECYFESYTAPTAPTVFKFSYSNDNKQLLQSTGFTVEWNGAKDGTNNPITSYELFLDGTPIGEKGANANDNETYSYSYKFEKGVDYQGKTIKVSIRAIGTQEVALYSEKKTIEGRVNTRPSAPSVSKSYSGDGVYISGNIVLSLDSQDPEDSQEELTYWRKVGDDWQPIQGYKFSATISEETTYVFKAKDTAGEFGPETSFTVYRYPELDIEKIEEASIEYNGRTDIISYQVNQNCEVETPSNGSFDFIEGENSINCVENFGLSNEVTFTFYPLDQNGIPLNCTLGSFPTQTILTPSEPTIDSIKVFDQYNDSNIINSDTYRCFYRKVRIKIPKFDSRIFTWDAFISFDGVDKEAEKIDDNSNYFYLQTEFDDAASVVDEKVLLVKLGNYEINLGEYYRIINFPFKNLASNNMGELIYTTNDNKPAPLRVSFSCDISELEHSYGLKDIEGRWQLQLLYGNNRRLVKNNLTPDTSSSPGTGTLSWGDVTQAMLEELGIPVSQYNGNKTFIVMVGVTNAYEETIYGYCEQIYDFNKVPELTYFSFEFQDDNGELKSPGDGYNFVEGMTIRATYRIKKWQAGKIAFEIQANNGKTTLFSFDDISHNSLSGLESPEISKEFEIPKITKTETWNLCLYNKKVSRSVGTAYNTFPVNDKSVSLTGFDYSHNDNETGTYTLKSFTLSSAAEGQLAYSLIFAENEEPYPIGDNNTVIIPDNDGNPLAPSEDGSGKDSVIGSLLITETVTNSGYTLTKKWYSNTVVIYSIVPTISYRKNRVGINTQGLDKELDSVFYVQRAGDGKYVTFATMTDEGIQGEIIFSLLDGSVAGMTIDCGSW